jgi:hypothetical protein
LNLNYLKFLMNHLNLMNRYYHLSQTYLKFLMNLMYLQFLKNHLSH